MILNVAIFNDSNKGHLSYARGFTLIEVIITLVIAAFMGTMLVTYMRSSLAESALTLISVRNTYDLNQVMENMTADYKRTMASTEDTTPLATFKAGIGSTGNDYNNDYGAYKMIYSEYITFSCSGGTCSENEGGDQILKVTIADYPGEQQRITALFTR